MKTVFYDDCASDCKHFTLKDDNNMVVFHGKIPGQDWINSSNGSIVWNSAPPYNGLPVMNNTMNDVLKQVTAAMNNAQQEAQRYKKLYEDLNQFLEVGADKTDEIYGLKAELAAVREDLTEKNKELGEAKVIEEGLRKDLNYVIEQNGMLAGQLIKIKENEV